MPSRSIWRSDKAQHFQLVHRSQQDPLTYDAESSSRVLKPTSTKKELRQARSNAAGPQTRADLERELGDYAKNIRANVGEAAQYGIMYDDTEYDYMQHLRAVGDDYHKRRGGEDVEDDTEVIMLEAPKTTQARGKGKAKDGDDVQLKEDLDRKEKERVIMQLPKEVLPSERMMPRTFESEEDKGLRPDMDPHLRQVLEALEDDAFLMRTAKGSAAKEDEEAEGDIDVEEFEEGDEEDIDDFFGGIVKDGELDRNEDPEWRHLPPEGEEGIYEDQGAKAARELMNLKAQGGGVDDLSLESRVALFKKAQEEQQASLAAEGGKQKRIASSIGSQSIFGEKGASRRSRHPGAKARLAATYYAPSIEGGATAFSMSSSAMERNQGLTGLDEQFDRMEKIYEQESDEDDDAIEDDDEVSRETPADIDAIFDDFLNKNEIVGNKLRERLGDRQTTSSEKVDILRRELGDVRLIDKLSIDEVDEDREDYDEVIMNDLKSRDAMRQEWDVQTVLTTRTNLGNHPRTIASATSHLPKSLAYSGSKMNGSVVGSTTSRMPRVRINPRTGMPEVTSYIDIEARNRQKEQQSNGGSKSSIDQLSDGEESDASSAETEVPHNVTITRSRNESKEEKKARKEAAKNEKRSRRAEKSSRKQMYEMEMNKQKRAMGGASTVQQATAVRLS